MKKFWEEMFTSHSQYSAGEDLADSIALIVVMALVCVIFFI
jgi:hypothetical protein